MIPKKSEEWVIVADDFTGAGDSSVQFRTGNLHVRLLLDPLSGTRRKLLAAAVVDTDSRFLSPEQAWQKVFTIVGALYRQGARCFFKKIDSTWRGNPAEETEAVMAAAGYRFAIVASAAPKNGRTVTNGICRVGGVPLAESPFGKDPFTPVGTSRIAEIMERRFPDSVRELHLELVRSGEAALKTAVLDGLSQGQRIFMVDAETMEDLSTIARLSDLEGGLFTGSSGLAEALGRRSAAADFRFPRIRRGQALFVIGSVTAASRAQCEALVRLGHVEEIVADPQAILKDPAEEHRRILGLVRNVSPQCALLIRTGDVLQAGGQGDTGKETGSRISDFLGALTLDMARQQRIRFLFASGGDTASKIVARLGVAHIEYTAELLPGLPFGYFRSELLERRIYFASKAGGFGDGNAMATSLALVTQDKERRLERKERTE